MKCRTDDRNDMHRKAIKQMAQSNYVGQECTCSDTMLNTHMEKTNRKDKHESTFIINKTYTFIIHGVTVEFHIPMSLGLPLSI